MRCLVVIVRIVARVHAREVINVEDVKAGNAEAKALRVINVAAAKALRVINVAAAKALRVINVAAAKALRAEDVKAGNADIIKAMLVIVSVFMRSVYGCFKWYQKYFY